MSRLLIVDDFPIIVDGLAELFSEKAELDMEIFRAYSVIEALEVLGNVRIDIVLSDIRMPVKTGIDLLKEIRSQWPRCKVIFLTSYNDFQYARDAISLGGYDYILKTEGDERIIESVCRALEELRNEQEYEELIKKSKEQYNQSKPILQKEFFTELLAGRKTSVIVR
nr:response regulator [Clostridiaceae bacterium]